MITKRTRKLEKNLKELYFARAKDLLFHGWHHIYFVTRKSVEFAEEFPEVDKELLEAAALVHDLNYLVEVNTEPGVGKKLRTEYLNSAGFTAAENRAVEVIILEAHTADRHADISNTAKALSDGDSLFKVMPLTPILLSNNYIVQNKVDLNKWSEKIITEQKPLLDQGIYFYTEAAKEKYQEWAELNLTLVQQVRDSLKDPAIAEMLKIGRDLRVF